MRGDGAVAATAVTAGSAVKQRVGRVAGHPSRKIRGSVRGVRLVPDDFRILNNTLIIGFR